MTSCYRRSVNPKVYQRLGGQSTMTTINISIWTCVVYQRLGGQSTMTLRMYSDIFHEVYQRLGGQSTMTKTHALLT